ncbi:MAG: type II toxin-antitoxin system HipA family toxin [Gammaproteobacteria bacterium]
MLYLRINGHLVGYLKQMPQGLQFTYAQEWLEYPYARSISLSMPLAKAAYLGRRVESFFDNLLPDSLEIRQRLQRRFNTKTNHVFELLSQIGRDCVGAIQLLTDQELGKEINSIQADHISHAEIANLLRDYTLAPLGMRKSYDFRISVSGAQEKTALLWHKNKWWLPHGSTPTTHILKLPIGRIEHSGIDLSKSVENEWLCQQILEILGFPIANTEIADFEDQRVLIVERFDRKLSQEGTWFLRLPQEDMCQALGYPGALKYEADGGPGIFEIMKLLRGSSSPEQDCLQFLLTQVIFWILGAIDGHAKNFSISLNEGGRYQLTPLYDVMSAYPLINQKQLSKQKLKMAMAVLGKNRHYHWNKIFFRHWLSTAQACDFSEIVLKKAIEDLIGRIPKAIEMLASRLPAKFPENIFEAITQSMLLATETIKTGIKLKDE